MEIFKRIIGFFKKRYSLFLVLIVLLSYGQMLFMQPWEDDQGLFIKMANLEANVGYFGHGPFGEGPYKYTAVPFIPVYYFFGNNTYAYFGLLLILYIVATLSVYKIFSKIFGEKSSRVIGFIFASGYIASDAIWRMTNGAATLISFMLVSLFFYFYWMYFKTDKLKYYLSTLFFFFLAVQYFVVRDHYLVGIVVVFEILFLMFRKLPKSILTSILRIIPFSIIFYYCVLSASDSRSTGALSVIKSIFNGKIDLTYGFFASLSNLIIPDYLTKSLPKYLPLFGVLIIIFFIILVFKIKKNRKYIALFGIWVTLNILAYWIYTPTVTYETISRYLSHSFFPLAVLFGILYVELGKKTKILIIVFGILNIYNSIVYQNRFLNTKSFPTKQFYIDLKTLLPEIKKGDILYFDVSKSSENQYRAAISAAMLPNSGSIAWRYSVDRYDFSLINGFEELIKTVDENDVQSDKIHGFWYTEGKLVDISGPLRDYFDSKVAQPQRIESHSLSEALLTDTLKLTKWTQPDLGIDLPISIDSVVPKTLEFTLIAKPYNFAEAQFPVYSGTTVPIESSPWRNTLAKKLSLNYISEMRDFLSNSKLTTNSFWQDKYSKNMYDNDLTTVWQSDRLEWQQRNDYLVAQLPKLTNVSKIAWISGTYSGSIPISYKISASVDGRNWKEVKSVVGQKINTTQELQVIDFENTPALYIKMNVSETFGGDSPMIAEFRVISSSLDELDLKLTNQFIENPFLYIENEAEFNETVRSFNYKLPAKLYWFGNKFNEWTTAKQAELSIIYDGTPYVYKVTLPPGGTEITKLKISDIKMPGEIVLSNVKVY